VSVAKPPSFEPLAGTDPVPGNTDEIAALGRRYTDTAAEIERQAANLKRLATGTQDAWVGGAGDVFRSSASDLSTRITKAHARYATAGSALTTCAPKMADAQQRAYQAVWDAQSAQGEMAANAPGPAPKPGSPPPTDAEKTAAAKRASAYGDASANLKNATARFHNAVGDYHAAAGSAARAIRDEIGHDGLKDSWWDRNFGWISNVFMIIGIVVIVLAVIALILICPLTAGLLAAWLGADLVATLSAAVGWAIFGLTVGQAIFDGVSAATGKESWTNFVIDCLSLATLGLGEGLGKVVIGGKTILPEVRGLLPRLVEPLTQYAENAAKSVAAGRAGRGFMQANGLPGFLYTFGSKGGLTDGLLRLFGKGDVLDGAVNAANVARDGVETALKGATPGNLLSLGAWSSDAATEWSKLSIIDQQVPNMVRVMFPKAAAASVIGLSGGAQWASFIGGNTYNIHGWTQGDDSAAVAQTIGQFRQMLSQVPVP
jgi:uncharacterized protein YukE